MTDDPQQYIFDIDSSQFEDTTALSILYTTSPCVGIIETDDDRELIYIFVNCGK